MSCPDCIGIDELRGRARVLLRVSAGDSYLDTGGALDILRELAGIDERDECVMPNCDGRIEDGICNECETSCHAMTLATFRAEAIRIEWCEAVAEFEEAEQSYAEADEQPVALWAYPGDTWLVEMESGKCELHLDRREWSGDRESIDAQLHEWAIGECNLYEPEPTCPTCKLPAHAGETDDDNYHEDCRPKSDADVVDELGGF